MSGPAPSLRVEIATPETRELGAIAALHRTQLGGTIHTHLGDEHLVATYEGTLADPNSMVRVARTSEGLAGFVVATMNVADLSGHIVRALSWSRRLKLLHGMLIWPPAWLGVLQSAWTSRPITSEGQVVDPTLVAIATNPAHRGRGAGRALVDEVARFVRSHGGHAFRLDTRRDNQKARGFYGRLGFTEVEQRGRDVVLVRRAEPLEVVVDGGARTS